MYVFDTNSLSLLGNYFPQIFQGFWRRFDQLVDAGNVISVREVYSELERNNRYPHIQVWQQAHRGLFLPPTMEETQFVADMFANEERFQALVSARARLEGREVADPFLIASANSRGLCLVTEERLRGEAIRIPYVCNHYGIDCTNIEGMLHRQGWTFD